VIEPGLPVQGGSADCHAGLVRDLNLPSAPGALWAFQSRVCLQGQLAWVQIGDDVVTIRTGSDLSRTVELD
jgi:hypothetical protein